MSQPSVILDAPPPNAVELRIPMSYEEYLEFDHTRSLVEWVNGEVIIHMPPIDVHQDLAGFLFSLLNLYVQFFKLGHVMIAAFEMRHLPGYASREPDILFIAQEHLHRLTRERVDGPADLVVEIISPDSVTRDRRDKFAEYRRAGVQEYWLIDPRPRQQRLNVYHLDASEEYQEVMPEPTGVYQSVVVPGFWVRARWLWERPLPEVRDVLREIAPQIMRDEEGLRQAEMRGRQEGREQGRQEGMEQGRQEGMEQGRQEGMEQGRVETVLRLLTRCSGSLDAELAERIRSLSAPRLAALTDAVFDFGSVEDVRAWLDAE